MIAIASSNRHRHASHTRALAWRVIRDPAAAGARNMALDHALATCLQGDEGVLRLYAWERPTVSFGRNEPTAGLYSIPRAEALGVDYVRRPTGGRAVLHDREVTYSVVAPIRALGGARAAYRSINEALAAALASLGASVALAEDAGPTALDSGPCFQSPAGGEVVADGNKLVGSAQARIGGALLQHGSIMLAGDQSILGELCGSEHDHPSPATLSSLVDVVRATDVIEAVAGQMEASFRGDWSQAGYDGLEVAEADRLESERYTQDSWTWRR